MANAAAPWENDPVVTQAVPWENDPVVEPSFTDRVSADWDKRNQQAQEIQAAADTGQQGAIQTGLQVVGLGAGKVNDVIGEALTSVGRGISAITPEAIKEPIAQGAQAAMESDAGQAALKGVGYVADKYGQLKQEYPNAMRSVEAAGNIVGAVPVSLGALKGAKGAANLAGDTAVNVAKPTIAENVKPLARRAREFGIDLRKDQVAPTRLKNTIQKVSQEVPFSGVGEFEAKQRGQWNKAVAKTLGLDAPNLSPENINQFLKNSSEKFDVLAGKKAIPFDEKRLSQINSVVAEAYDSIDPNLAQIVDRNAGKLVAAIENGTISGEKLGSIRSELVKRIPNASGDAKSYLSNLVEAIDDSIEPVLSAQEKEILATARRQWRNYKTVEPLLEGATDGQINPTQLLNRVKSSKYIKASRSEVGKDDLVDLARIGKEFLPMKAGSDTFQKAALGTGATGLLGYAVADPIGALTAAGVAGAGMTANRAYQGVNASQKLIDAALKERKARFGLKDVIKNESSGRPNLKTKIKKKD